MWESLVWGWASRWRYSLEMGKGRKQDELEKGPERKDGWMDEKGGGGDEGAKNSHTVNVFMQDVVFPDFMPPFLHIRTNWASCLAHLPGRAIGPNLER